MLFGHVPDMDDMGIPGSCKWLNKMGLPNLTLAGMCDSTLAFSETRMWYITVFHDGISRSIIGKAWHFYLMWYFMVFHGMVSIFQPYNQQKHVQNKTQPQAPSYWLRKHRKQRSRQLRTWHVQASIIEETQHVIWPNGIIFHQPRFP